jgi:hypothetical protein
MDRRDATGWVVANLAGDTIIGADYLLQLLG